MAEGTTRQESCERLNAAAYLDGELAAAAALYFEDHQRMFVVPATWPSSGACWSGTRVRRDAEKAGAPPNSPKW